MQNATPHSASPSGEATVPNSSRFFKTSDPPTERLYRSVNQEQPVGTALAPTIPMNMMRSAVNIRSPEANGVHGLVDDQPAAPPRRGQATGPREDGGTRLKRTRSEPDPEPGWPRRPLAELSESSHNSGGGEPVRSCVHQQGCHDGDTVAPPRSDEAQSKKGAQPPPIASARCGPDCHLAATSRDTSSAGAETQRDAPRAVEGVDTAGATAMRTPAAWLLRSFTYHSRGIQTSSRKF